MRRWLARWWAMLRLRWTMWKLVRIHRRTQQIIGKKLIPAFAALAKALEKGTSE